MSRAASLARTFGTVVAAPFRFGAFVLTGAAGIALGTGRLVFARGRSWGMRVTRSRIDFAAEIGDPLTNSIVGAVIGWLGRNFPEAPVRIVKEGTTERAFEPSATGPGFMLRLLESPNEYYSGQLQWRATLVDWYCLGNGYWYKRRAPSGRVMQLWWMPSWMMEPRWPEDDDSVFISHYDYTVNGVVYEIPRRDIVHFRNGLDPRNPRKGQSRLMSLSREIFTDEEAGRFTASLLRNLGVPGVVISPSNTTGANVFARNDPEATPEKMKERWMETFGGDNRGEPAVFSLPTDVKVLSFNPQQMELKAIRRIPEERVSAVLGVPAGVAQLGAGLDRNTFCLPADARVWTTTGARSIVDIRPGDEVWSFRDGELVARRVRAGGPSGVRPIYRIRTKNRVLRASGNHPVLTRVPGTLAGAAPSLEWRRADELARGDEIVQPTALPEMGGASTPAGEPVTRGLMQFLGAIVGDGTILPGAAVRVAMPIDDRVGPEYRELARSLFTRQAHSSGGAAAAQALVERVPITVQEAPRTFAFSSARDSRWLASLGVAGRARTKRIPGWIFGLRRDLRLAFLAGLVDSDGHIDARGALTFAFASRDLTADVKDLLLSCRIASSNLSRRTISADQLPNPGAFAEYEAWTVTASSARAVGEIPFADPLYRARVDANPDRHRPGGGDAAKAGLGSDLGFYTIGAIDVEAPETVYDLEIEGTHSFIADGVVVHNTNYGEANVAAYTQGVVPDQRLFAAEIEVQLLPEFASPAVREGLDVWFDWTQAAAMQVATDAIWKRNSDAAIRGLLMRSDFLRAIGRTPASDGSDNVYIYPQNYLMRPGPGAPASMTVPPPPPATPPQLPAGASTNGWHDAREVEVAA